MREERLHEIMRAYVLERAAEQGGDRPFERATKIARAQFSRVKKPTGQVSWLMLARISETIGPKMSLIFSTLAGRISAAEDADRAALAAAERERELTIAKERALIEAEETKRDSPGHRAKREPAAPRQR